LKCPDNRYDLSLDAAAIQIYVINECIVLSELDEGANMGHAVLLFAGWQSR